MRPKLIAEFKNALSEFYGAQPKESKDISRMVWIRIAFLMGNTNINYNTIEWLTAYRSMNVIQSVSLIY
jgi:hypothetical protein